MTYKILSLGNKGKVSAEKELNNLMESKEYKGYEVVAMYGIVQIVENGEKHVLRALIKKSIPSVVNNMIKTVKRALNPNELRASLTDLEVIYDKDTKSISRGIAYDRLRDLLRKMGREE